MAKKKIAILGGGPAGLSAAYHLTSPAFNPDWREQYEVTVFQLGWRLGGKGASGRNEAVSDRIEEHGIHLFGNMYANSLHMLRACYEEVKWPQGAPATKIEQAVLPSNFQFVTDYYDEKWHRLPSWLPENKELPWEGGAYATPGDILAGMVEVMISILSGGKIPALAGDERPDDSGKSLVARARGLLEELSEPNLELLVKPLSWALNRLRRERREPSLEEHGWLLDILSQIQERIGHWIDDRIQDIASGNDSLRWMYVQFDLLIVCLVGMIEDKLWHDIDKVDGEDYRSWLARHGASDLTLDAALPQAIPNTCMQYPGGDSTRLPTMSASAYLTFVLRQIAARGQSAYFFQVSTGETVILPLYKTLLERGVKFEFFTKVENLVVGLDPAGKPRIDAIDCRIQARVKGGPEVAYEPTRRLPDGQEVWPTEPLYDQLVEGKALRREGIDLESWWTPWRGEPARLERGTHFDFAVVAMPIACHEYVCREALAASPAWRTMAGKVQTTPTQALQIWLDRSVEELGWRELPGTNRYIGPTFATPLVAFGDFSDGIRWEGWPADAKPRACIFFCGPFQPPDPMPPFDDHGYPERAREQVRGEASQLLRGLAGLFPRASGGAYDQRGLNFGFLHVPRGAVGAHGLERFDHQYYRANIDPNERYTLSVPGTLRYRLKAWESGIGNAVLCGDWIYTGFNIGSFEGAVMSGMLAAHTLTGRPQIDQVLGYGFMRTQVRGSDRPWLERE